MRRFHRNKINRPPGAGLTYCAGFDLGVRAGIPTSVLIEVEQRRWGGTDLDPPRKLARHRLQASLEEITLSVSTDEGVLGHPCADVFHFTVSTDAGEKAEFEVSETQGSRVARVIHGRGWTAAYPELAGPNGLRIEYRPRHGYLD